MQPIARVEDGAAGARADRFSGDGNCDAARQRRLNSGECALERFGQMAGQQQELGHAEAAEFAQQPNQKRPPGADQKRLRCNVRQRTEACAETAGEDGALSDRDGGHRRLVVRWPDATRISDWTGESPSRRRAYGEARVSAILRFRVPGTDWRFLGGGRSPAN